MRKFIFIIVLFLGATLVFLSFSELESIVDTLKQGAMRFIVLAVVFQLIWFGIAGLDYNAALTRVPRYVL